MTTNTIPKIDMKKSCLHNFIEVLNSFDVVQRKDLFLYPPVVKLSRKYSQDSLDQYRRMLTIAGYLKVIGRGKYKRLKHIPQMTSSKLQHIAYPKSFPNDPDKATRKPNLYKALVAFINCRRYDKKISIETTVDELKKNGVHDIDDRRKSLKVYLISLDTAGYIKLDSDTFERKRFIDVTTSELKYRVESINYDKQHGFVTPNFL